MPPLTLPGKPDSGEDKLRTFSGVLLGFSGLDRFCGLDQIFFQGYIRE